MKYRKLVKSKVQLTLNLVDGEQKLLKNLQVKKTFRLAMNHRHQYGHPLPKVLPNRRQTNPKRTKVKEKKQRRLSNAGRRKNGLHPRRRRYRNLLVRRHQVHRRVQVHRHLKLRKRDQPRPPLKKWRLKRGKENLQSEMIV